MGVRRYPAQLVATYPVDHADRVRQVAESRNISVAEVLREILDDWARRPVKAAPTPEWYRRETRFPVQMVAMVTDETNTKIGAFLLQHRMPRAVLLRRLVADWSNKRERLAAARVADVVVADQGAE